MAKDVSARFFSTILTNFPMVEQKRKQTQAMSKQHGLCERTGVRRGAHANWCVPDHPERLRVDIY